MVILEILIDLLKIKVYGYQTHQETELFCLNFIHLKDEMVNKMGIFEILLLQNHVNYIIYT